MLLLSEAEKVSLLAACVTVPLKCECVQLMFFYPLAAYVSTCAEAVDTFVIPFQRLCCSSGRADSQAPKAHRRREGKILYQRSQGFSSTSNTKANQAVILQNREMPVEANESFQGKRFQSREKCLNHKTVDSLINVDAAQGRAGSQRSSK